MLQRQFLAPSTLAGSSLEERDMRGLSTSSISSPTNENHARRNDFDITQSQAQPRSPLSNLRVSFSPNSSQEVRKN